VHRAHYPQCLNPLKLMAKDKDGKIVPYHPGQKWRDGSVGADLPMRRLAELFTVNHFIVSQVNPHVAPFLIHLESKNRRSIRSSVLYLIKSELKHRVTQLADLGLIPAFLSTIQPIVTQKYHGDITIVPEIPWRDYLYLFSNPTEMMISDCIVKGQKATWPKLAVIENHLQIEQFLELAFEQLKQEMSAHNAEYKRAGNFPI